jgi:NAD(P)-dependent dehydrogenase (short-subunit alcohol dehydrogenase family)
MSLAGRSALITGASRGLGLSIAGALGAAGASIACMARAGAELDGAVAKLKGAGVRAVAAPADVTKESEVAAGVAAAAKEFGRLDVVVLNAGTWQGSPIARTSESQWDLLLDLNLKGAFLALKHAIPHLGRGSTVVGIASLGAWVGQPGAAAYSASKWGLRGLLESAALELKPQGVRVSIVSPHSMNSANEPIANGSEERAHKIETDDVAALVAHICAAPDHVSIGNVTVWPVGAGLRSDG